MLLKYIKYELERLHVGVWLGVAAVAASLLVPMTASAAGQITTRSVTPSTSAGAATGVTYTSTFTLATSAQTLGSIKVEICDSPLATTACSASSTSGVNSNGASFSSATLTSLTGAGGGAFSASTKTGASTSGTSFIFTRSASAVTGTPTLVLTIGNVTNPTGVNQAYYFRISTYSDTAATTPSYPGTDFGAVAMDTTQSVTVNANVQESLTFCVGTVATPANCAAETGSTVNIGTGTDNILSTSPSGGISTMLASTNASSGYAITYTAGNLSSSSDTITAINGGSGTKLALPGAGTAAFGINLMSNTAPSITNSAAVAGSGTGVASTNYATTNQFAFVPATATTMASAAGPTVSNTYTVSYAAQAGATTKPGAFTTTFNYIATGTF
ncbi:hypothetical protein HJC99_04480 [Candidatus Saccharibacteria bacterium]|nr:hypothetical protein [Candidatus Saccharibacteria bacterium]